MDTFALRTLTAALPISLTALIGREREQAELRELLGSAVRLVTLTGPGGVGKTRLAVKTVTASAGSFADRIWFVDLAPLRDPDQVIPAIAQAIGIAGRTDTVRALLVAIGTETPALLVLDNFEQVVRAAPAIAELLQGAPGLKALVTSREPLKIGGEREYPIAPLPLPTATAELTAGQISELDAVRLFAERAQAVSPTFTVTPDNAAAVAEICRRLDGLPLAIELAAARVKALPLPALLDRLEQRLPLLVGDRRDAPARQQTMRDAIAWSISLLTESEQTLFRRLGVFVGGFTLEAAEAIGAVGDADLDVLRVLSSLVDKSLVRLDAAAIGGPRYLMLETIREFALEQLLGSDEAAAVRNAHAAWFSRLAEERRRNGDIWNEPKSSGHRVPPVVVEYGNVRAAMAWFDESGNVPEFARMVGAVYWYWHSHGPRSEGLVLLRQASRSQAATPRDKESRMWSLEGQAMYARNSGHLDEATNAAQELNALALELGDIACQGSALANLGYIALARGDYDRAEALARQAIAKRNESSSGWSVGIVTIHLGQAALGKGDLRSARSLFDDALVSERQGGHEIDVAVTLGYLALVDCEVGAYDAAATRLLEAIAIWRDLSNQENISEWLAEVAVLADATGNHEASVRFLAAGAALRDAVEHAWMLPERATFERTEQSLRDTLGPDDFAGAYQAGLNQPLDKTLEETSAFLTRLCSPDDAPPQTRAADASGLTPRELDVLRLLVQGKSDREIAEALFIGARTVETHVSNLLTKLGATNRTEATARALQNGLVDEHR